MVEQDREIVLKVTMRNTKYSEMMPAAIRGKVLGGNVQGPGGNCSKWALSLEGTVHVGNYFKPWLT